MTRAGLLWGAVLGQRVNNFEIVRLLGQGGMGAVYEAEHLLIRKKVAVKVLRPELAAQSDLMQRFFNEARATSAIHHPNIVEVIDLGLLSDGVPYLVMELLEGEGLGDRLHRLGRLSIDAAVDFACQTASALEAAHQKGIIHRDLKPDNLFLVRDQRFDGRELVKVLDFGIAKLRGDLSPSPVDTAAGTIWGTPTYMSPEQCRGLPAEIDHRSDIYALGVIVYEAICGRPPFSSEGAGDVMMMHMSLPPEALSRFEPKVTPQLEHAVLKALAKRPDQRFSRMAEFASALRPAAAVIALPTRPQAGVVVSGNVAAAGASPLGAFAAPGRAVGRPSGSPNANAASGGAGGALEVASAAQEPDAVEVTRKQRTLDGMGPPEAPTDRPLSDLAAGAKPRETPRGVRGRAPIAVGVAVILLGALVLARMQARPEAPRPPAATASAPHPAIAARQPSVPSAAPPASTAPKTTTPASAMAPAPPGVAASDRSRRDAHASHVAAKPTARAAPPRASAPASSIAAAKPAAANTAPASPPTAVAVAAPAAAEATATAAQAPGYLNLDSEPWANVSLNGKSLGTTPLMHVTLPPGKHVLTLANPELGVSTSYSVDIQPGVVLSRLVSWRKP